MNKRIPLLLLAVVGLTGCVKTDKLYTENQYNSPVFDENYYIEWDGIDTLEISKEVTHQVTKESSTYPLSYSTSPLEIGGQPVSNYTWRGSDKETLFGYNYNLGKIEKKFNYGVLSKLFDGRIWCDELYQKSRVQVNKTGFAMFFPKSLTSTKFLGFACRGGSNLYDQGKVSYNRTDLGVNFTWSFYIPDNENAGKYNKVTYQINDAKIPTDNNGNTTFVSFNDKFLEYYDLSMAVGMSFEWELNPLDKIFTERPNLSDDYRDENKDHLALMLYEVFIGESTWY